MANIIALIRHHRKDMLENRLRSFWTKGSIQYICGISELLSFPSKRTSYQRTVTWGSTEPAMKNTRKGVQANPSDEDCAKNLVQPTTAASVSSASIALLFFVPPAKVNSIPDNTIALAKVSKESMIWHQKPPPVVMQTLLDSEYE